MTYEAIMRSMMKDMPDDIDTSEGSLIFNACAKQAVRLEEAYLMLAGIEQNMYADTADLEHLIRNGNDRGCYIKQATYAEMTPFSPKDVTLTVKCRSDHVGISTNTITQFTT